MQNLLNETIKQALADKLNALETYFGSDVCFFCGEIRPGDIKLFRDFIEKLHSPSHVKLDKLVFILNTPGGSAEAAEKMVEIIRYHYKELVFVVPDYAMSAGTILCMAGDEIFMDYSSSLGPIDPQVFNGKEWVPALGYIDKVKELVEKAKRKELTDAEFLIFQNQDLALLARYEQALALTVTLLKKWLVEFKFRNWTEHRTNPKKKGKPVTDTEKQELAEQIARILGDNKRWHSHGRMIGIGALKILKLEINDYSSNDTLRPLIRSYNDLLTDHIVRDGFRVFMHNREYF